MDLATLKALISEARKNEKKFKAKWMKHDGYDDMKDMEFWNDAAGWLESKLPSPLPRPQRAFVPCPGCDGYECDKECKYPGAVRQEASQ